MKAKELKHLVLEGKEEKGKVVSNRSTESPSLNLGFIEVGDDQVAFTPKTKFQGVKMKDLKTGDSVVVEIESTSKGLHAKTLKKVR